MYGKKQPVRKKNAGLLQILTALTLAIFHHSY